MAIVPVIVRELRAQARQPLTYLLRIFGGLSLVAALVSAFWTTSALTSQEWWGRGHGPSAFQTFGIALFGKMNLFIFAAIWLFVPLAAADAVSRERREGTLSLLYLTELRPLGILVGKAFVHILRSASLFVTMGPWLMLPLLFGGIELRDIAMALLLDSTAVLLAMAAGLLASTFPRDWLKSVLLAEILSVALLLLMLHVHAAILSDAVRAGTPTKVPPRTRGSWRGQVWWWDFNPIDRYGGKIQRTSRLLELATNGSLHNYNLWPGAFRGTAAIPSDWQQVWVSLTPAGIDAWFHGVTKMLAGAALVLLAATWLGAWRVARSWRDAPDQPLIIEFRRQFLIPRFAVPVLKKSLSRALTANPIGWLQNHSPSARMVKWTWCLFIILVEIYFSSNSEDLYEAQGGLALLLLLGLAFSATASFREELETGAFELLLVTPLREWQIIAGRARGLWRQFFPALLVYGGATIYLASGWSEARIAREAWLDFAQTFSLFCTLPLIGLYFSVQRWNFFLAWLAACLIGLLPAKLGPALGAGALSLLLLQTGMALAAAFLLQQRLQKHLFLQRRD
jgi:ABC-type transport system involved in multi-copper enzyme maturation permease subunit